MFRDFLKTQLDGVKVPKSQADYVEFGYGQVEPNHLSAQRTGQIYAQLPAQKDIKILEQGQFVKYDYSANDNDIGQVDFTGPGEWMLVYNEVKLYRNHPDGTKQWDCEFAMLKDDYQARVYSPYDYEQPEAEYHARYLNGKDAAGGTTKTIEQTVSLDADGQGVTIAGVRYAVADNKFTYNGVEYEIDPETHETKTLVPVVYTYDDVTKDVPDIYEPNFTNDPYTKLGIYREKKMPEGMAMVPRVFKTNIGDLFTTNTINAGGTEIKPTTILAPGAKGILAPVTAEATGMKWEVVKVYTMPDGQKGVKVMRIA